LADHLAARLFTYSSQNLSKPSSKAFVIWHISGIRTSSNPRHKAFGIWDRQQSLNMLVLPCRFG
jgi:hypothetical protein